MFLAIEPQTTRENVSQHAVGLFKPSEQSIRQRKIALRGEHGFLWRAKAPLHGQFCLLHDQCVRVVVCIG